MNSQELASLETLELELEFFEPITRDRSNTWPLPRPEGFIEATPSTNSIAPSLGKESLEPSSREVRSATTEHAPSKKKHSTRNAHGGPSYAELITQAISGAKDQRLTLSEIYAWMIEHAPTIKDKEGSSGWRNSVRHNLSLHNRFTRVPNESAGKSSWWTINPNEMFGKSTRRRSASMEAKKYQASRCRAKKTAQAASSGISRGKTSSDHCQMQRALYPSGAEVELAMPVDAKQLLSRPIQSTSCTVDYSYCRGRLSPIPAVLNEAEWIPDDYDNRTSRAYLQTTSSPFVFESQSPNEQTLTTSNSFLDDVNDIISKEMIDCKLNMA